MAVSFSVRNIIHLCMLSVATTTVFALALPFPLPSTSTPFDRPTQQEHQSIDGTISKTPHARFRRHVLDHGEASFDPTEWYIALFLIIALSSASIAVVLAARR